MKINKSAFFTIELRSSGLNLNVGFKIGNTILKNPLNSFPPIYNEPNIGVGRFAADLYFIKKCEEIPEFI
jgi:hypothetical protein